MWKQKIQDLRNAGLKWRQIGEKCGLKRSSVHDIWTERTKEPSPEAATKLRRLHTLTMKKVADHVKAAD